MVEPFECDIEVRGFELDSFGHVNNAVYIQYLEHARWKLLEAGRVNLQTFKDWQAWPVIAHIDATYIRPTFLSEKLRIFTTLVDIGKTHYTFEQSIQRLNQPDGPQQEALRPLTGELVFKGRVKAVMVNSSGRPTALPQDFVARFEKWMEPKSK